MRKLKQFLAIATATMMAAGVFAAGTLDANAAAALRKVKYDKKGEVEIDFNSRVQYKNVKVTVKDQNGNSYTAFITEKDDDELDFRVKNYREGLKYTFTISGVKARGESGYGKVAGTFSIPKSKNGGTTAKGWVKSGKKWSYYRTGGKKVTGWQRIGNKTYFFNRNGVMQTGWLRYDGDWYYLKSDGSMARQEILTIGGVRYFFDEDGEMCSAHDYYDDLYDDDYYDDDDFDDFFDD